MKKNRIAVVQSGAKPLVEQSRPVQVSLQNDGSRFWLAMPGNRKWKWESPNARTPEEFKLEAIKWILSGAEKHGFIVMPPIEWIDRDFINRLSGALEKSKRLSDADMIFESEWQEGRFHEKMEAKEIASRLSKTLGQKISEDFVYKRYFYRGKYPYRVKSGPKMKV